MKTRRPTRGRRASVAAVLAGLVTVLLPSAHAEAAVSSHFSLRLHETFTAGISPSRWGTYEGQPGGNPYGYWMHSHVQAYNGAALLRGYRDGGRYVTGGFMLNSIAQTYGKYVVRAKFDRSTTVEHAMLLWPTSGWPPEVDFSEGPTSQGVMATSHWGASNSQLHAFKKVDMTQWHTYGVEWTPTRLLFTVDGVGWASMGGSAVPHQRMKLAVQTVATSQPSSTAGEVRMSIADVYVWSYS
ncbi:MAG: family 16 glycosylhydrolase [Mycobacteriales bacterium]